MTERERLTQIEEVVSDILQKQDRIAEELTHLTMKVASNSIDILSLKKTISGLESQLGGLENRMERLEGKMERLESKIDNHTQMIIELQHDVRSGQNQLKTGMEAILQAIQSK
jgi:chromosome segregation ATPase